MTQEQFEKMCQCNEHIKAMERVKEMLKVAFMGMYLIPDFATEDQRGVAEMYHALIDQDERMKLTCDYRAKMTALIDEEIKRSKEEFEKI